MFVRVARSDLIGPEKSHGIAIRIACKFCEEYEGRRPDPFYLYLVNDVSIYLGRQRGGVVPD